MIPVNLSSKLDRVEIRLDSHSLRRHRGGPGDCCGSQGALGVFFVSRGEWPFFAVSRSQGVSYRCPASMPNVGGLVMLERGKTSIWRLTDAVAILFMQAHLVVRV